MITANIEKKKRRRSNRFGLKEERTTSSVVQSAYSGVRKSQNCEIPQQIAGRNLRVPTAVGGRRHEGDRESGIA